MMFTTTMEDQAVNFKIKNKLRCLIVFPVIVLVACSHRAAYENIRIHNQNACKDQPAAIYRECMEEANKSYDDYLRENRDVLPESNNLQDK